MKLHHCLPLMALLGVVSAGPSAAQSLRDPTLPPAAAGLGATPDGAPPGAAGHAGPAGLGALTVIVREGRPYLVVDTRLYAQGERWGQVRIERITETQVWLRESRTLHKLPRFAGIERRASAPANPVPHNAKNSHHD